MLLVTSKLQKNINLKLVRYLYITIKDSKYKSRTSLLLLLEEFGDVRQRVLRVVRRRRHGLVAAAPAGLRPRLHEQPRQRAGHPVAPERTVRA